MALFSISEGHLIKVESTTFQREKIFETKDLQQMFCDDIEPIVPGAMVLAEKYNDWEGSRREMDLLCLDKSARLIVVELKRTKTADHAELQAIRYASMVSTMSFTAAVSAHKRYLTDKGISGDAEERILRFLEWDEPQEAFGEEVAIVLVSGDFSQELMSSVLWLNKKYGLDIRCVALRLYKHADKVLVDIEQRFPLADASEYQFRNLVKEQEERQIRERNNDLTRFDLEIGEIKITNLPKNELVFYVVKEAISRGASPREVLSERRIWIRLPGIHDAQSFAKNCSDRDEASSTSPLSRFFTSEKKLIHQEGDTYAFTNQWGPPALEVARRTISSFEMSDVRFSESV